MKVLFALILGLLSATTQAEELHFIRAIDGRTVYCKDANSIGIYGYRFSHPQLEIDSQGMGTLSFSMEHLNCAFLENGLFDFIPVEHKTKFEFDTIGFGGVAHHVVKTYADFKIVMINDEADLLAAQSLSEKDANPDFLFQFDVSKAVTADQLQMALEEGAPVTTRVEVSLIAESTLISVNGGPSQSMGPSPWGSFYLRFQLQKKGDKYQILNAGLE